ncbi:hypothetical protein F0U60_52775 [Archangium minus]|uniref:Uncharacterized protein n=1 Tax=Archangium minus TaxID=83450 RepID=A0ABY9X8W2_9BACT|nr:hypothetical protein F0U61_52555 [Archangium violaceum]WNG51830.1 hypothetical protein F0U60_52775 [Archangium minus]
MTISRLIQMNFINNTSAALSYYLPANQPVHGIGPEVTNTKLGPQGSSANTSTVSSNWNNALAPGPEGAYQWNLDASNAFMVSYEHPAGNGETWVKVICPPGYVCSSPNTGPNGVNTFTDPSLEQHEASITITFSPV